MDESKKGKERGAGARGLSEGAREFLSPKAGGRGRAEAEAAPEESPRVAAFKGYFHENYRSLVSVTLLALVLAIAVVALRPPEQDIDLRGGVLIRVEAPQEVDAAAFESSLHARFGSDLRVRTLRDPETGRMTMVVVEAGGGVDRDALLEAIKGGLGVTLEEGSYSIRTVSPSISGSTYAGVVRAVFLAFALMGAVIFLSFREPVISAAVMLCAFTDVTETYAVMSLVGIKVSLPTIAALLMLIGYSVDSDILLSTRAFKRTEGSVEDRIASAFGTGIAMTLTTVAAVAAILLVSTSTVLREIAAVLLIGLLLDIPNTWIQNAGIIKWRLEEGSA